MANPTPMNPPMIIPTSVVTTVITAMLLDLPKFEEEDRRDRPDEQRGEVHDDLHVGHVVTRQDHFDDRQDQRSDRDEKEETLDEEEDRGDRDIIE